MWLGGWIRWLGRRNRVLEGKEGDINCMESYTLAGYWKLKGTKKEKNNIEGTMSPGYRCIIPQIDR